MVGVHTSSETQIKISVGDLHFCGQNCHGCGFIVGDHHRFPLANRMKLVYRVIYTVMVCHPWPFQICENFHHVSALPVESQRHCFWKLVFFQKTLFKSPHV